MSAAGVSASARPFAISGIALAIPPVPVLVPTPAPVRLNHNSSVNVALRRSARGTERRVLTRTIQLQSRVARRAVTVNETVTVFESAVPSFALYVKLSGPV